MCRNRGDGVKTAGAGGVGVWANIGGGGLRRGDGKRCETAGDVDFGTPEGGSTCMTVCACGNVSVVCGVCFPDRGDATGWTDGEKSLREVELSGACCFSAGTCAEGTGVTVPNEGCSGGRSNVGIAFGGA